MSEIFARLVCSLSVFASLALFLAPRFVSAEPLLLLYNDSPGQHQEVMRNISKKSTTIGLNKNGDMEIRHGGISLVVAYNAPDEYVEPQERIRSAQRQDSPAISGLSLRINFMF